MWSRALVTAAVVLATAAAIAGPCETLTPTALEELPQSTLVRAHSVAWLNDRAVAVGSDNGIYQYALSDGSVKELVAPRTIPHGMTQVEDIATDGRLLVGFNDDYSDLALDLGSSRIVAARRNAALQVIDMAVRGQSLVVLGFPAASKRESNGALWSGRVGAGWESFRLLHKVSEEATESLRSCLPPFGGAVVIQSDGTIAMITAAEPGVVRYGADGKRLPTLGGGLTELVPSDMADIRKYFFGDVLGRYQQVLNQQPIADDLVETPNGLAVVVRNAAAGAVWWELWFPGEGGGTRRRIRLALDDKRVVGGHLRCNGRGTRLACLFGKAGELYKPDKPYLALFDLTRVTRNGSCGGS